MRVPIEVKGLFNSLAENKTPPGRMFAMQNASTDRSILEGRKGYSRIGKRPGWQVTDVSWGMGYGKFGCNETQALQLTGNPTGGTVVVRSPIQGATNSLTIPVNAYPSDAQAAVAGFTAFDDGELVFSGGPWPNETMYVTYKGRYGDAPQSLLTLQTNSLTGGSSPGLSISHFVNGGPSEGYLVVIQPGGVGTSTLYWVTSADGFNTTTWTVAATGLTSSDWFFQQYGDKIFAVNATDGLTWYQIGGTWNGSAGIPGIANPPSGGLPTANPYHDNGGGAPLTPFLWNTGGNATFGNFLGWGTDPTITVGGSGTGPFGAGSYLKVVLNAAIASGTVSFTVTLHGNQDLSKQDYLRLQIQTNPTEIAMTPSNFLFDEVNADPATLIPGFADQGVLTEGVSSAFYDRSFHYGSADRALRNHVNKMDFTLNIRLGTSAKSFYIYLYPLDTWPNDMMDTLDITGGATRAAIEYAYSWKRISDGKESKLSTRCFSPVVPDAGNTGTHIQIAAAGSAQMGANNYYTNFYRKDRFGLWRRIGQVLDTTGTGVQFIDTNMLDELDDYPVFGVIHLPGGVPATNLGIFKQSLAVAGDRKVWLAEVGNPLVFAPDPEDLAAQASIDISDIDRPRTVFMSSNRAEPVVALVGQDSLYLSGDSTSYAMTNGDRPSELSPPRIMPGSRGCVGTRAAYSKSGGAAIAAVDGLWYYAVSSTFTGVIATGTIIENELTIDVRTSYAQIIGSSYSGSVVIVHQEEDYIFNGKQYLKFTRNKQIEQGTLADSVKALFSSSLNGLIGVTSDGSLIKFGVGILDDQTQIAWSASTGLIDGPRSRVKAIEVQFTGSPKVRIEAWDGDGGYDVEDFDLVDGKVNHYPAGLLIQGYRYRVTFSGTGADTITEPAIIFDAAPAGKGN